MVNLERRVGKFDDQPLVIAENPDKPVVQAERLATGVLKVKRGEKPTPSPSVPGETLEEKARAAWAELKELGRKQGGTSQGSPGSGTKAGGFAYRNK